MLEARTYNQMVGAGEPRRKHNNPNSHLCLGNVASQGSCCKMPNEKRL
jgi:hypothetical protein